MHLDNKRTLKRFFNLLLLLDMIYTYLYLIRYSGKYLYRYVYNDTNDYYMDYFNSIFHIKDYNPYDIGSIYPPFTYMIYGFFRELIPDTIMFNGGFGIRSSQNGQFIYIIYTISVVSILYLSTCMVHKERGLEDQILTIFIILSYPFIFAFERGNIILLAASACSVFIANYNSRKMILREISIICLAIAINIKIYPVIYSLIFLKRKRFLDFIKLTCYSTVLFVVPFHFMGGIRYTNIKSFIVNIIYTNNVQSSVSFPYLVSLKHAIELINKSIKIKVDDYIIVIVSVYIGALLIAFLWANEEWQEFMVLSIIMVALPNMSSIYSLVFLFPAIIQFLDNTKRSKINYAIFVFAYLIIKYPQSSLLNYHILPLLSIKEIENVSIHLKSIFILVLTIILITDILYIKIREMRLKS